MTKRFTDFNIVFKIKTIIPASPRKRDNKMKFDYEIVTDSSSNLPKALIEQYDLPVLPFGYTMGGKEYKVDLMSGPLERQAFFAAMRIKVEVTTSLVNFSQYTEVFEKILLSFCFIKPL